MAQSGNTFDRYDLATSGDNVREDLSDIIYNISPTEVPFTSNVGRETSSNTYKEWMVDSLAAASDNKHIDGDEFSGGALDGSERIGNYHQISRKDLVVSRRANIVNKAGRRSEMAYQIAKRGKELRRDIEHSSLLRKIAVIGTASIGSEPESAGVPAWIRTNLIRGTAGTAPALSNTTYGFPNALGTEGATHALSEDDILQISRQAYDQGGSTNMIMLPPQLKQSLSSFLFSGTNRRIATQYQDHGASPRKGVSVVGAVDVYVTDFQVLDIVPNRFSPAGTETEVMILDTEYWALSYLDGYHIEDIAKVGDHRRRMLLADWTVCSKNEAASGLVGDVGVSMAVSN